MTSAVDDRNAPSSAPRSHPARLSVLDLVPVRTGQTTSQALAASIALAKVAEACAIHRYWVAEHHNMPAVAATNPPVLVAMLAAATKHLRVGSGGVMLPNHAPLVVAEQFALLEAAHPGRIDLGLGRAPGSDPLTSWALRHGGPETAEADRFDEHVDTLVAMLRPEGVGIGLRDGTYPLRATPQAVGMPQVWLLGSSDYSARLAASRGLPYVFAHHFSGRGTKEALDLYRSRFRPSPQLAEPRTFLTVNAAVASEAEAALRSVRPQLLAMVALRTGGELGPVRTVEEAERVTLPVHHQELGEEMLSRWVVGTSDQAVLRLRDLAEEYDVDEVMVHPIAGASEDDPLDRVPARERTLELLSAALWRPSVR